MTAWAIRLVSVPDGGYACNIVAPFRGNYLAGYDADAHEGLGDAVFTAHPEEALRFGSFDEARECWFTQSTVMPTLENEVPNRPLAVVSISIDEIADAESISK